MNAYEALTEERYSRASHRLWWPTPELAPRPVKNDPVPEFDDSEVTVARRRRLLLEAVAHERKEGAA